MIMRLKPGLLALAALLSTASAGAGELLSRVSDGDGQPVADAVVSLEPVDSQALAAASPALWQPLKSGLIDQRDETFLPYVKIVGVGGELVFRNSDVPQHHVYSFSPAKTFEFFLRPGTSSPPVVFDKPGIVAVGCNIHDRMISYVFVTRTPWVALTDKSGEARIASLPPGAFIAHFWHPALPHGAPMQNQPITIADAATTVATTLVLEVGERHDHDHTL
jgi:plastocyanin